jgi:hypothetical protein
VTNKCCGVVVVVVVVVYLSQKLLWKYCGGGEGWWVCLQSNIRASGAKLACCSSVLKALTMKRAICQRVTLCSLTEVCKSFKLAASTVGRLRDPPKCCCMSTRQWCHILQDCNFQGREHSALFSLDDWAEAKRTCLVGY